MEMNPPAVSPGATVVPAPMYGQPMEVMAQPMAPQPTAPQPGFAPAQPDMMAPQPMMAAQPAGLAPAPAPAGNDQMMQMMMMQQMQNTAHAQAMERQAASERAAQSNAQAIQAQHATAAQGMQSQHLATAQGMATGGGTVVVQHVVKQQQAGPLITEPYGGGLFGCFNDFGDCVFTILCPGIVHGMTSSRFADGTDCGGVCLGNCIGWHVLYAATFGLSLVGTFPIFWLCECRPSFCVPLYVSFSE